MSENFIESIRIKGFKSIFDAKVDLRNLNIIIGANGTGKSNFLSLFSFIEASVKSSKSCQKYVEQNGIDSLFYKPFNESSQINISVSTKDNILDFNYVPNKSNLIDSSWNMHPRNSPYDTNISVFYLFCEIASSWKSYHFYDTSFASKIKASYKIKDSLILANDAHNLAPVLFKIKKDFPFHYEQIVYAVKMVIPYFNDFILEEDEKNCVKLDWLQDGDNSVFESHQISTGTLRFISLATLLLKPRDPLVSTLIIDEPELGLHPFAISILAEIIKTASEEKQIIVATQSKDLIDNFHARDIIVTGKDENGSVYERLKEDELAMWLEEGYSLGKLWSMNIFGGNI